MLTHVEQDIDIGKVIHRCNTFTASLKRGQFINLQINHVLLSTEKIKKTSLEETYTIYEKHTYNYIIMIYYNEEGDEEPKAPKPYLSSWVVV